MYRVVFVHGVATREGANYALESGNRDAAFAAGLFAGKSVKIENPMWGKHVPSIVESFKKGGTAALSMFDGQGMDEFAPPAPSGDAVAELARTDGVAALDAVYATVLDQADIEIRPLEADELAAFGRAVDAVEAMSEAAPGSLSSASGDTALVDDLAARYHTGGGYNALTDRLGRAVGMLGDRARNVVSIGVSRLAVDPLNPLVGRFLGDVFAYLKNSTVRDSIREEVLGAIRKVLQEKAAGDKVILIGHSLGGVILYDLLSNAALVQAEGIAADALVTVGSQSGFFQELGLFDAQGATPGVHVPRPASVTKWFSVFDPIDPFGFPAKGVFSGVEDYSFNSTTGLIDAHTTYFKRPQFHARLRKRMRDAGALPE